MKKLFLCFTQVFVVFSFILWSYFPLSAASLYVENSTLMGINDLVVGQYKYDLRFVDGYALDVFSYTYTPPNTYDFNFAFNNSDDAYLAAQMLLGAITDDNPYGLPFFSDVSLIHGIGPDITRATFYIPYSSRLPYQQHYLVAAQANLSNGGGVMYCDPSELVGLNYVFDAEYDDRTWVVFSNKTLVVPIPSTIFIFGISLLGLAGISRKRRN